MTVQVQYGIIALSKHAPKAIAFINKKPPQDAQGGVVGTRIGGTGRKICRTVQIKEHKE